MATIWNNKKKDWFLHKTRLVSMHDDIFKNGSRNSTTFKMELFATVGNVRAYNQWMLVFAHCCGGKLTIVASKIKIGWKWSCLKGGIRNDFLFCGYVLHFFKNVNYFLFYFENWLQKWKLVSLTISPSGVLLTEASIKIRSAKCC